MPIRPEPSGRGILVRSGRTTSPRASADSASFMSGTQASMGRSSRTPGSLTTSTFMRASYRRRMGSPIGALQAPPARSGGRHRLALPDARPDHEIHLVERALGFAGVATDHRATVDAAQVLPGHAPPAVG